MPRKPSYRPGQIGDYWLSRRPNSGAWCRTWFDPQSRQTKRASLGTEDFPEAQLKLAEWITAEAKMQGGRPQEVPLETILLRYYHQHARHQRSSDQARYALERWSGHFPEALVSEVTPDRLRGFVKSMQREGLSGGYIRRTLAIGQAALNRAHREGEITAVPRVDLGLAPESEPRERLASPDEVRRIFAAVRHDWEFKYLTLSIGTAARPEAILQLGAGQIDCDSRLIRLNPPGRPQNKKRRPTLPMAETLVTILTGLPPGPVVRYVTVKKRDGKLVETVRPIAGIRTTWRRLIGRARLQLRQEAAEGVRRLRRTGRRGEAWTLIQEARRRGDALLEVTPYTIRHTVASEMRRRSVPVWEVAGFLGHSSGYKTTERYAKYGADHLSQAVAAIDAYFADLGVVQQPQTEEKIHRLRASSVLVPRAAETQKWRNPKVSLGVSMVEPRGVEPLTSTMPL